MHPSLHMHPRIVSRTYKDKLVSAGKEAWNSHWIRCLACPCRSSISANAKLNRKGREVKRENLPHVAETVYDIRIWALGLNVRGILIPRCKPFFRFFLSVFTSSAFLLFYNFFLVGRCTRIKKRKIYLILVGIEQWWWWWCCCCCCCHC